MIYSPHILKLDKENPVEKKESKIICAFITV